MICPKKQAEFCEEMGYFFYRRMYRKRKVTVRVCLPSRSVKEPSWAVSRVVVEKKMSRLDSEVVERFVAQLFSQGTLCRILRGDCERCRLLTVAVVNCGVRKGDWDGARMKYVSACWVRSQLYS